MKTVCFLFTGLATSQLFTGCITTDCGVEDRAKQDWGTFSKSGGVNQPDQWWMAFHDEQLNAFIDEALVSELTLKSVWQRLRAACAVAEREAAPLFPQVDGVADLVHRKSRNTEETTLELGLEASYELDLWGRIRSAIDAEQLRAKATRAEYQTVALSLSAEVARTWFQLTESLERHELLQRQIETNEKLVRQLRTQFGDGQTRAVDVLRQEQLLAATRQQKIAEEAIFQVLEHRLAILLGRPAQKRVAYRDVSLPDLPSLPATGVPARLICRRPDVQRAFVELQAADRDVASAIADQFPRITLSGSLTTTNQGADQLFKNWMYSLIGNLVAPLIDGHRREAEVMRTQAVKRQLCHEYGQTVLIAFQEVEDALILEEKQLEQIEQLDIRIDLAEKTYDQLLVEYVDGVSDFIDFLTALTDLQQLRRDRLFAKRVLLEYRISLYRALAGGLEPAPCTPCPIQAEPVASVQL